MIDSYRVNIADDASLIEREFLEALARIVANKPMAAELLDEKGNGQIKPSQSKVAIEAGHSRTLISGRPSTYPRVQVEIRRAIEWFQNRKKPKAAIADLDEFARKDALGLKVRKAIEKSESMKRQRDAAYTSEAASVMLAQALDRHARTKDVDVMALRRLAEQKVLTRKKKFGS